METAGIAFAAMSLFYELEKCGKSLHGFSRDMHMPKKEVKLLKTEVNNCRVLASIFEETIKPVQGRVMQIARERDLERSLASQSRLALEQILEITRKLRPLSRHKRTGLENFQAKIRWHFAKGDIDAPIAVLQTVKASLNLLSTLSILDCAVASATRDQISNPASIYQVLQRIKALERQAHRTDRQLRESVKALHEHHYLDGHLDDVQVMTGIIEDMRKPSVKNARDLVKRLSNQHPFTPAANVAVSSQLTYRENISPRYPVGTTAHRPPGTERRTRRTTRSGDSTREVRHVSPKRNSPVASERALWYTTRDNSTSSFRHRGGIRVFAEYEESACSASNDGNYGTPHTVSPSRMPNHDDNVTNDHHKTENPDLYSMNGMNYDLLDSPHAP
ncbi:hypothetical protein N7457_007447 [Penicillium paradoxum]|uniref:uncharacterized protein n=1 Tax=Penicillium paradoxum TaxID=176176 RepID=UPI0025496AD1|nr:uncharacterized protein N7457_007447 [Penicillium paradoxum]KAJ5779727.1 hypothetical protein N7457_007447 [Penicillium paradoxum]